MKKNDVKLGSAYIVLSVVLLLAMGCSAHSLFILKNTYENLLVSHKTLLLSPRTPFRVHGKRKKQESETL